MELLVHRNIKIKVRANTKIETQFLPHSERPHLPKNGTSQNITELQDLSIERFHKSELYIHLFRFFCDSLTLTIDARNNDKIKLSK